jgi:hypothetical protein
MNGKASIVEEFWSAYNSHDICQDRLDRDITPSESASGMLENIFSKISTGDFPPLYTGSNTNKFYPAHKEHQLDTKDCGLDP